MVNLQFSFSADLRMYQGKATWFFITLPKEYADEIKFFQENHVGFGTVRVAAQIGDTQWKTSLFPDKKSGSYLLPIKASVRKKENIHQGDSINVGLGVIR